MQAVQNRGAQHHLQADENNGYVSDWDKLYSSSGRMYFDTAAT